MKGRTMEGDVICSYFCTNCGENPVCKSCAWDRSADSIGGTWPWTLTQALTSWDRVSLFFLRSHAPELNPVEELGAYLKQNPLAKPVPPDLQELTHHAQRAVRRVGRHQDLPPPFIAGRGPSVPRK